MSKKQWHPLFAHLLGLLLEEYYQMETNVPVSELPRSADLLLIRRQSSSPPFVGLWSHLTEYNLLEFKGPTDDAEDDDLELLVHVGTGLTFKHNENLPLDAPGRLANRQFSFWYLAPCLGDTFLGRAKTRMHLDYQTGGLWRSQILGHPLFLLAYQDSAVEEDTIPLHLLDLQPPAPASLGELLLQRRELLTRFADWLVSLQLLLWQEIRHMDRSSSIIDWEEVGKVTDITKVLDVIPLEVIIRNIGVDRAIPSIGLSRVIESVGLPRVIEAIGLPKVVEAIGLPRVVEAVGLPKVVEAIGPEKIVEALLSQMPAQQIQEILQRKQSSS